jgi:catechol 2,3-dioxygenase
MATLPLDLDDLLAEQGGEDADEAMPDGTTLGHVHLQVADLDRAESFWVDALGLDVMARGLPGALFASAGGYHHHVGLNTWAGVGAPTPPPGARGLVRFDLVLPDAGAVEAAAERLARVTGVELADDGVLAVDPSGNAVLVRSS